MSHPRWTYCELHATAGAKCDFGDVVILDSTANGLVGKLREHFGLPPEPSVQGQHSAEVRLLNVLGSQGWEYVHAWPNYQRFYLKKRVD